MTLAQAWRSVRSGLAPAGSVLLALALCLPAVITPAARAAQLPATEFDEMYADVAAYLMDPHNNPDLAHGKVRIEYGDARAYMPAWVYLRDRFPELKPSPEEFSIAREMHARYRERFDVLAASPLRVFKDPDLAMDAAIGIEGIFRAYEHDPQDQYRDLMRRYLDLARPIAVRPGLIMDYHAQPYGPATVLAGGAWFYLEYALAVGPDDPRSAEYRDIGLAIIASMDKKLYSKKGKKYLYSVRPGYDFTYAYNNAVMVQALARAYVLTGEKRYLDRAHEIVGTMERDLYHPGYRGFLAAEDNCRYHRQYRKVGPQYNNEYMALSDNNYLVYAYLTLYETGGFQDQSMLEKAAGCLRFIRDWLWDHHGQIQHHIERGIISEEKDYCMGCNFQTLYHIVQYKAMLLKIPVQGLEPKSHN